MDDIAQLIQWGIVILLALFFISVPVVLIFYKGKVRRITVVKKRRSPHGGLNSNRSKYTYSDHFTIDCRYEGSDKLHTLGCTQMIYDNMREGKTYTAHIKLMQIKSFDRYST